jgi:hypothetical protein
VLHLNEKGADLLKMRASTSSLDIFWDNYDLVLWKKNNNGFTDKKGMFRKGTWGIATRLRMTQYGTWVLNKKYVKYFK